MVLRRERASEYECDLEFWEGSQARETDLLIPGENSIEDTRTIEDNRGLSIEDDARGKARTM